MQPADIAEEQSPTTQTTMVLKRVFFSYHPLIQTSTRITTPWKEALVLPRKEMPSTIHSKYIPLGRRKNFNTALNSTPNSKATWNRTGKHCLVSYQRTGHGHFGVGYR